jgi:hypothetical protein
MEEWNPLPYVKKWLSASCHAATGSGKAQKKTQPDVAEAQFAVWKCY